MTHVINGAVIITAYMRLQSLFFFFFFPYFPSAEGLVKKKEKKKKKTLISNLPKRSLRVISLSLFAWTAQSVSGSLHKVL